MKYLCKLIYHDFYQKLPKNYDHFLPLSGKPPNITLRVISRIEQPFVMFKKQNEGEEVLVGNDRFEVSFVWHRYCPSWLSFEASSSPVQLELMS